MEKLREESDRLGTAHFHLKTVSEATALLAAVEDLLFWQLLADFTENGPCCTGQVQGTGVGS